MKLIVDNLFTEVIAEPPELEMVMQALTVPDASAPVGYTCFLDQEGNILSGLVSVLLEQLPPDMPCVTERSHTPPVLSVSEIVFGPNYLSGTAKMPYMDREYQEGIARKAIMARRGIIQVGTGGGKTEIAALIYKWLREHQQASTGALHVVGDKYGLQQACKRFETRGLGPVGRVGDGEFNFGEPLTVAIVDSLYSKLKKRERDVYEFLQGQDVVMFDEVQHLAAASWFAVGVSCPASYRYGMSGMPFEHPKKLSARDMSLMGLTGPVVAHLSSKWLRQRGYLAEPVMTWYFLPDSPEIKSFEWQTVYREGIVNCVPYNSALASIAMQLYDHNFKTLFFVAYKQHGFQLLDLFRRHGYDKAVLCHGDNKAWQYQDGALVEEVWDAERVFDFVQNNDRVLLVGTPFIDEGADLPSLNALILGGGMKKYGRVIQRIGRGLRPKADGDNRVFIFDIWTDYHSFLNKHAKERQEIYEDEAYTMVTPRELPKHLGFDINVDYNLDYGEVSDG
jgi:superfamily II DNA or RNA helicase